MLFMLKSVGPLIAISIFNCISKLIKKFTPVVIKIYKVVQIYPYKNCKCKKSFSFLKSFGQ